MRTSPNRAKGMVHSPTHSKGKDFFHNKEALKRLNRNLKSLYEDLMSPSKVKEIATAPRSAKKQAQPRQSRE
jgi:hypothetical protein